MGKLGKAFVFLIVVMMLLTVASRSAASFTVVQVTVETPKAQKIEHKVTGNGVVEKMQEQPVYVAADVLVEKINVQEGQSVKKGQVLATLDMDSLKKKIQTLNDEVLVLQLENDSLASTKKQKETQQGKDVQRAKEDYKDTMEKNQSAVDEAKQKLKDTKKESKKAQKESDKKTQKELQDAIDATKQAYEDAVAQQKKEEQQAKRALEDAKETPQVDYSDTISQIEIDQKQRKLDGLKKQLDGLQKKKDDAETEEEKESIDTEIENVNEQIKDLTDEIVTMQLQKQEKADTAAKQNNAWKKTLARAQEDYDNVVEQNKKAVEKAKKQLEEAEQKLEDYEESAEQPEENSAIKDAKAAVADAKQQKKEQKKQAKRNIEDAAQKEPADHTAEINNISIAEKQRQLAGLMSLKNQAGRVKAQMSGTVTSVQISVGQQTGDTSAFLIADTSGGMRFTTQISKEDATYVLSGDLVTLQANEKKYEDLEVLSTENTKDELVKVTVYVPKKTLSLGEQASMEISKFSKEYSITVPITAVHTENDKNFVYVMKKEKGTLGDMYVARKVRVTIEEKNETTASLSTDSLMEDVEVFIDTNGMISSGEKVRLTES